MKQYYCNYIFWEDYINGMYEIPKQEQEEIYINLAVTMLTNVELFLNTCKEVLANWPISSSINLTNKQCNRRAWLGQSCCSYKYKVPETCTRIAWSRLSISQQSIANEIAEKIINSFELNYEKKDIELYK